MKALGTWLGLIHLSACKGDSANFGCRGLKVLARQRPIVSHGGHHLNDGRAGRLRVAPLVQQGCVRRPFHDTVRAIGRESDQIVLQFEPTGFRLFGGTDHRKRFVPQTSQAARLGGALRGGTKL